MHITLISTLALLQKHWESEQHSWLLQTDVEVCASGYGL